MIHPISPDLSGLDSDGRLAQLGHFFKLLSELRESDGWKLVVSHLDSLQASRVDDLVSGSFNDDRLRGEINALRDVSNLVDASVDHLNKLFVELRGH